MVKGPLGGPRPLLSLDCLLVIRDYTALPSPTISGGTTPDRTDEFREAARSTLPVDSFSTDPHMTDSELFGDYLVAELDADRLQLDQFLEFVEEYARLLGVEDLRVVNVGIDARTKVQNRLPRPLVDDDVTVFLLLELRFPPRYDIGQIERILDSLESELDWVADTARTGSDTAIVQHHSGVNDLVVNQILELIDLLEQYEIQPECVTATCNLVQ